MRLVYNTYTAVCPPVREIIHSLKLKDHLLVQADKPCYVKNQCNISLHKYFNRPHKGHIDLKYSTYSIAYRQLELRQRGVYDFRFLSLDEKDDLLMRLE